MQNRRVYDISIPITAQMAVYKNKDEKRPRFERTSDYPGMRETRLHLDAHTGTHLDAPMHAIQGGDGIDRYPLESMLSPCDLFDLTEVEERVTAADLKQLPLTPGNFVLFKTRNSFGDPTQFDFHFVYVDRSAAEYLAEVGVKGVGVDGLGVERAQPEHDTHNILFQHGIAILEGLRLSDVQPGAYTLVAAPLNLVGVDASPVRALLLAD